MGPLLQDEIAERRGGRADESGVPADAADGPVGVLAITVEYALALLRETQNPAHDATPTEAPPASPISAAAAKPS